MISLALSPTSMSAQSEAPFATVVEALDWWRGRDITPLCCAVVPPCDQLGDEIYDAMLAVFFKNLVRAETVIERVALLDNCAQVHGNIVDQFATIAVENRAMADENVSRICRMIVVIERWKAAIAEAAAEQTLMGEPA